MNSNELRELFLRFFVSKGHLVVPSSSLVPHGDPTLLLTTAGMVQMKPYFMGLATPSSPRMTSCQKCFRTTDIDSVGDTKHLTFFEMLGNFSVGDYFKKEAISWAWEFVTGWLELPEKRLWTTVFLDDDEAAKLWQEMGVPAIRIVRLGEKDNFWGPAGDSGPCGPCSEIHYDLGEEVGCCKKTCNPSCDCGRFVEIWNLVFMQFNQDKQGKRIPLPRPNIDTGMGLERISAIMQGKTTVYDTDVFGSLLKKVSEISGVTYEEAPQGRAMRIVAEHSRGIAFLIADGVLPGNEGRGYVLRRLLRRAALLGKKLGVEKPFLAEMADTVIKTLGHAYPELQHSRDFILRVVEMEEERFQVTLGTGLQGLSEVIRVKDDFRQHLSKVLGEMEKATRSPRTSEPHVFAELAAKLKTLNPVEPEVGPGFVSAKVTKPLQEWRDGLARELEELSRASPVMPSEDAMRLIKSKVRFSAGTNEDPAGVNVDTTNIMLQHVSGEEAFILYDTYGFPIELTKEIAHEKGFGVDEAGFEDQMEQQRLRARAAAKFGGNISEADYSTISLPPTIFVGYETLLAEGQVIGLHVDGKQAESAQAGQNIEVILDRTPFYAEMGGQVGDRGRLRGDNGVIVVANTVWVRPNVAGHRGRVAEGSIKLGDKVLAEVEPERRMDIARNHTSTHLLHAGLRHVLGTHVQQRGSLVSPERLRFDFSHLKPLEQEQLYEIQDWVNETIRKDLPVITRVASYKEAVGEGVIALFGEKYGDKVRIVQVGEGPNRVSAELCGGTHVSDTGQIGQLMITSESSVGSGLRRIEAVTGRGAEGIMRSNMSVVQELTSKLKAASPDEVSQKVAALQNELEQEKKRSEQLERELARRNAESMFQLARQVNGITVLATKVQASSSAAMRDMGDILRSKLGSGVIALGAVIDDRPQFLVMVTLDLTGKGLNAGEIARKVAHVTGGGGGGRPEIAQAGGKDKAKLEEAIGLVATLVEKARTKRGQQ
ncbi:MAG: alanine--tRNA ligase [Chloroflexi bacterium]|nr:alanine--tRNA ligase [Chloroflexota bacterium]